MSNISGINESVSEKIEEKLQSIRESHGRHQPSRSIEDFAEIVSEYARRARYAAKYDVENYEEHMVSLAAAALTALENFDNRFTFPCGDK